MPSKMSVMMEHFMKIVCKHILIVFKPIFLSEKSVIMCYCVHERIESIWLVDRNMTLINVRKCIYVAG